MTAARRRFFSLKWKISLSLVGIALVLVGLYVAIAKQTFESDKISYVFDSQQVQLAFLGRDINQKIERALFDARSILSGANVETRSLSAPSQLLFDEDKPLLAIELRDDNKTDSLIKVERTPGALPAFERNEPQSVTGKIEVRSLGGSRFLVLSSEHNSSGSTLRLRVVVELANLLPPTGPDNKTFLIYKNQIIASSSGDLKDPVLLEIAEQPQENRVDVTTIKKINGAGFLISKAALAFTDWRVITVTSQEAALGALGVLYQRSLVFIAFSFFATIFLSLLLSLRLTRNLQVLTQSANQIGRGDFTNTTDVVTSDEIGILGQAFSTMSHEIQRLLDETKDKARMEEELKTARVVQDSLFPVESEFRQGEISLAGHYMTSTECGGDWWYYFSRGDDLYLMIADATGHGTPAALITSAARSVFSMIENSPQMTDLSDIARSWDNAVASCSNRKVYMTALIMKIATKTGEIEMVNACHEWPILISSQTGEITADFLELKMNHTLGETKETGFIVQKGRMGPGDRLVVYTDGLTGIENPDGQTLGERRLLNGVKKISAVSGSAEELAGGVLNLFEKHRKGHPLPDDVTLVILYRA